MKTYICVIARTKKEAINKIKKHDKRKLAKWNTLKISSTAEYTNWKTWCVEEKDWR